MCLSIFELNPHLSYLELDTLIIIYEASLTVDNRTKVDPGPINMYFLRFFGWENHGKSWATHSFYPQGPQGFPMGLGSRPAADEIQLLWMKLSARLAARGRMYANVGAQGAPHDTQWTYIEKNCYSTEFHKFFLWEFWELIDTWRYCPCLSWFTGA